MEKITGTIAEAVAKCKTIRKEHPELKGRMDFAITDRVSGLNVRSVYGNGKGMYKVFNRFTSGDPYRKSLFYSLVDFERDAVVATNGMAMLICDKPEGMTPESAKADGFRDQKAIGLSWWLPLPNRKTDDLSALVKLGEVEKGSDAHNTLMAMALCSRAYDYTDKSGFFHTIYGWVGKKVYNIQFVASLVDALFRLGNTKVGIYEQKSRGGYSADSPLHLIGMDGGNNSRGLLMPIRFGDENTRAFEFPIGRAA